MSQLKTTSLSHKDNPGTPNITLFPDGTTSLNYAATGFKNAIINGDYRVWQRGATGFTTSGYSADRWNSGVFTTTLKNTERGVVGGDVSALPESLFSCAKTTVTSSGAVDSYVQLDQPIEGVRTYAGQEVTLSFYASADSALSMSSEAVQFFGKDPGVSAPVSSIGVQKYQLVANKWTRFSKTFTLPSVAGKVISNSDSLKVVFWLDAGSNLNSRTDSLGNQSGTFYITGVQLEPGPTASDFEFRFIGTELALCQRYYQKADRIRFYPGSGDSTSPNRFFNVPRPVTMRATPIEAQTSATDITFPNSTAECYGMTASVNVTSGAVATDYTADAEL
jgi:hypothetical protein